MSKKPLLLVAVPALLCGALLGHLLHPAAPETATTREDRVEHRAKKSTKAVSDDAALNRLRKRIADLERQLAEKSGVSADLVEEPLAETPPTRPDARPDGHRGPPTPEEMRARMDEMRRNDPERYTRMTNHFANMRTHQLERAQNKLDILAAVDVNRLSPKQKLVHEQYQDLIARQEELRNLAFAPDDGSVTDEQRRAAHEEMHKTRQQLHAFAQQEREILLSQTARSFGVKGDAGKELVETVKAVYEATESWGGFGRGGRGHGPGRGGPPPPPGR